MLFGFRRVGTTRVPVAYELLDNGHAIVVSGELVTQAQLNRELEGDQLTPQDAPERPANAGGDDQGAVQGETQEPR